MLNVHKLYKELTVFGADEFKVPCKPSYRAFMHRRDGMFPIDPDYYMLREIGRHWSGSINPFKNSTVKPSDISKEVVGCTALCPLGPIVKTDTEADRCPQIAELRIEDIGSDLMEGVKTKPLKEVNFTPPIYRSKSSPYFDKEINDSTMDKDGNYRVEVVSYIASDSIISSAWSIFYMQGLSLIDCDVCNIINGSQKYRKIVQIYKFAVTEKDVISYIQLVCNARRVKYLSNWYKEGDVITLFVKHHCMPDVPSPAVLAVRPMAEQTFVPMLPKQKLQIITDSSQAQLEFKLGKESALIYTGSESIAMERSKRIGTNVKCDFFECIKHTETQELVFVNSKTDNQFRTINVPYVHGQSKKRYPVIVDPVRSPCVIYAHNIDGFILRSYKKMWFSVDKNCPLQPIYEMESDDYNEVKVKLTDTIPYFRLERINNAWIAKSN